MKPHPLCTQTYLKEISDALRSSAPPEPTHRRRDWSILSYSLGLFGLVAAIAGLLWLCSLPKPDMHDREILAGSTDYRWELGLWGINGWDVPRIAQQFKQHIPGIGWMRCTYRGELRTGQRLEDIEHPVIGDEYLAHLPNGDHWVWTIYGAKAAWIDP